jgi:hypothetical protein
MSTSTPETSEAARVVPPPTSLPPGAAGIAIGEPAPGPTAEAVLALVQKSPEFVRAHDRAGWLGLFGKDGFIEDPVGSPPAPVADGTLGRFWDTFIGPNEVIFEVLKDYQVGRAVYRDVVIHTKIGESVRVDVPAYLLYEVAPDGTYVERMGAHWRMANLSLGAMKMGPAAWLEMTKLFARMLRLMGLTWVGGYLAALWDGVRGRGPRALERLAQAIGERDVPGLADVFADDQAAIALGSDSATPRTLLGLLPAGAKLTVEAPVSAGWRTGFRFRITGESGATVAGLGLAEFAPGSARITRLRLFPG